MRKGLVKLLMVIIILGILGATYKFSSENSSVSNSRSEQIAQAIEPYLSNETKHFIMSIAPIKVEKYEVSNYLVRKTAHMAEYALLGLAIFLLLRISDRSANKCFMTAVLFCLLAAGIDEYHQSFTGRTSSFYDVLIDTTGCLVSTGIAYIVSVRKRR